MAFSLSCLVPLLCLSSSWEETLTHHPSSQLHSHRLFSPHPYGRNNIFFINARNRSHVHSRDTWTQAIQVTPLWFANHMFFTTALGNLRVTCLSLYGSHMRPRQGPTLVTWFWISVTPQGVTFAFMFTASETQHKCKSCSQQQQDDMQVIVSI